jgi:hypothetical protein
MKNFKYLFLLLCTIFVFEMTSFNKAEAGECTVTSGVVAEDDIDNSCDTVPDIYEVVIYKLYLCTSAPTEATTSSTVVLTPCSQIFNSATGATASVTQGADVALDGTYTRPPNGIYTHGYAYMDNTFGITWSGEIEASMTGMTGGTGVFCATVAGSGTHAQGSTHNNSSICSSTDNLTAGKFVETMKQFGGSSDNFLSKGEATNINGTTASIVGLLVDTNGHRAASTGEVVKLEGLVSFANPVVVTTATTSLSMSFNVGEGMHLNDGGSNKLQVGSGPFQAIMTAN